MKKLFALVLALLLAVSASLENKGFAEKSGGGTEPLTTTDYWGYTVEITPEPAKAAEQPEREEDMSYLDQEGLKYFDGKIQDQFGSIKEDISNLHNIVGFNVEDATSQPTTKAFISGTGTWNNIGNENYQFVVVPILAKPCSIDIVAKSVFYYAGLKTYSEPSSSAIDFSSDSAWNGRKSGTTLKTVLPNDINYLLIWVRNAITATVFEKAHIWASSGISGIELNNTNFSVKMPIGKNLLDRDRELVGYVIERDGSIASSANNSVSDYIPVTFGDYVTFSGVNTDYPTEKHIVLNVNIYDERKELLTTLTTVYATISASNPQTIRIPRNAKYIRATYRKNHKQMQIEYGSVATQYEEPITSFVIPFDYLQVRYPNDLPYYDNPWCGKKLVVDGDSISHDQGNYNYWMFIAANALGMKIDTSKTWPFTWGGTNAGCGWRGIAGSRLANDPVDNTNEPGQSIILRYQYYPNDADLVMILGGSNDWAHGNVPIGEINAGDSDMSWDGHTWYGALNILCHGLKEKYPTIPVVLMTPIKRGVTNEPHPRSGYTQKQFVDAMKEVCEKWGVYCLDMFGTCPINPNIESMKNLLYNRDVDLVHPNTEGQRVMGDTVTGFIRTLK